MAYRLFIMKQYMYIVNRGLSIEEDFKAIILKF